MSRAAPEIASVMFSTAMHVGPRLRGSSYQPPKEFGS